MAGQWWRSVVPEADETPPEIDTSVAHPARIYDYWLGGKTNFAADREVAEEVIAVRPTILRDIRGNREFLARAVRYLAGEAGIRQFLDIGTGIPSANNTHEVAQSIAPESRIVYVDNDRSKSSCAHGLPPGDSLPSVGGPVPRSPMPGSSTRPGRRVRMPADGRTGLS